MIPFVNLKAQHDKLKGEIMAAVEEVLDSSAFSGGPFVARFEEEFARFCGTRHCVGVASGTHAVWLALLALGVGPGDEVITVANTFIATVEAIVFAGAKPVFVDIDEETFNIDPRLIERAITPRTKAIIPVHLYGQMAEMDAVLEVARRHKLYVVEDAAQAHGAEYKARRAGSIGDIGCFSFYPAKNLGACGEAGACVTNDPALRDRLAKLRDHGQSRKYCHERIGWNGRMDGIQAAILGIKLKQLEGWTRARRSHAQLYGRGFANVSGVLSPRDNANGRHVYHLYVLRVNHRDQLLRDLDEAGVQCAVHYPVPLHLQDAFAGLGMVVGALPVTERCAKEIISLPVFPQLTAAEIEFVIQSVKRLASPAPAYSI